ncbi:hypothetical protein A7D17_14985 [Xanthomonas floridensis]|uniref:Uncharacterized protein n=1 Tax=Xanthomonas floridensis TaxID=1843580 RepID=A0A1A9MEA4_9XANT|nr:hypothetical protein A7D17_14985 [Xanthomonas floridensis]
MLVRNAEVALDGQASGILNWNGTRDRNDLGRACPSQQDAVAGVAASSDAQRSPGCGKAVPAAAANR